MTITANQNVSKKTIRKAKDRATQCGENVVVYKMNANSDEMLVQQSVWEKAGVADNVTFLAVIDSDGNYVD